MTGGDVASPAPASPAPRRIAAARRARGDLLFVSGQIATDAAGRVRHPGDAAAQAEEVFARLVAVLAEHGCRVDDVVKLTTYLVDMADLAVVVAERSKVFGEVAPAATTVQVAALARPGLLLEIEAVADIPPGS